MKLFIKKNISLPEKNNSQSRPAMAVALFCLAVLTVCFYNSRKVVLWETMENMGRLSIFKRAVLAYADASETAKTCLGMEEFFQKEHAFWRSIKESPLVFGQPEASLSLYRDDALPEDLPAVPEQELPALPAAELPTAATTTAAESSSAATAASTTIAAPVAFDITAPLRREGQGLPPVIASGAKKTAPFRILIVGDSFMAAGGGLGDPLERVLMNYQSTMVVRQGKVSSGLSRQDYFDWPALTQKLIAQNQPNVAVMMFGANDNIPVIDAGGKLLAGWGSANWGSQYRARIRQMMEMFTAARAEIFVIGVPVMKNQKLSQTMEYINSLYQEEIKNYPNAHYISTWDLLSDQNGNYTDSLIDKDGRRRLIRTSDGVHLQYYAGYYVANAIAAQMSSYLDLRPK